ncbi:MAG: MFS transporter, partial [Candidatus Sumerlaeia bacterium]|nr:MFS transporter [Candidatus Sumerlaeia bacterium]
MHEQTNKKAVLLIATTTSFLMPFMGSAITVALPSIEKTFAMNAVLLSWIISAYLLSVALFLVPIGKLADIYGRKRIFLYGLVIFTSSSFLAAVSFSPLMLIIARIIQGAGAAMLFGMGVAIITSVYPAGERGKVLGINVAAVYIGLSCGPFVGGILTHYLGWRSIFVINVPLGLFILSLVLKRLKLEWAEARGERFDLLGSVIYCLVLIAVMLGLSFLPSSRGIILILAGIIGLCIFIRHETTTSQPVLDINLFTKNTVFAFSNLAALINYSATFAVSFLLSLYLQYIKGLTPQYAGLVLVAQPVTQALFSPFAGRLSDKIEPLFVASSGMLI